MDARALVAPAVYGAVAAAAVTAAGYALADWQSVSPYLLTVVYVFAGLTGFSLLAGTSSFNENSVSAGTLADQQGLLSAPTEAGTPRRLLLICFSLGVALSGIIGMGFLV